MSNQFELFQDLILHQLLNNNDYLQKTIPFIKQDYFEDTLRGKLFISVSSYIDQYINPPNEAALKIHLQNVKLTDKEFEKAIDLIPIYYQKLNKQFDDDWLIDTTEGWCKKRAFYLAIVEGSTMLNKKIDDFFSTDVPQKMEQALAISFDSNVGLNYRDDYKRRYEHMHDDRQRFEFDLDMFNKVTKNGLPRKTLSVLMSTTTGGFKSGTMCHLSSRWAQSGYNVLYITLEMSEEEIGKRIDANLMDIELDSLETFGQATYEQMAKDINDSMLGNIVVKEYPTSTAHAGHFRHLIKELKNKQSFVPDIICVDYLNICASARLNMNNANSFTYVKSIAEELRALAIEFDVAMVSATQGNRDAVDSTDISIANVSESIGLPSTVDILFGIIFTEEMDQQNIIQFKQLKNRLGDCNNYRKFNVGINKAKMQLFDCPNQPTINTSTNQANQTNPLAPNLFGNSGSPFNNINFN